MGEVVDARRGTAQNRFGSVVVMHAASTTAAELLQPAEPPSQVVDVVFVESGVLEIGGPGGEPVRPRFVAVVPRWVPQRRRLAGSWAITALQVDSAAVETLVPRLPDRVEVFPERTALQRGVHAFAAEIAHTGTNPTALERYATEQLLTEMVGSLLLDRLGVGWSSGSPTAALRDRAIAVIAQSRADPELNAERVARAVQSSLRRVQAAFAEVGTSISAEIRRQRARLARSLLTNSRYDVLTIEQVAEQSGFGTTMSLRRALTDQFGVGPSEMRATRGAGLNEQFAHEAADR
ncbi:helix-turn-helix domain-containing protein [Agromyces bauzanensis]